MAKGRRRKPVGGILKRAGPKSGARTAAPVRAVGPNSSSGSDSSWAPIPATFRHRDGSLPPPWEDIFGPLRRGRIDDLVVVAQCGQSIDARIATPTGHSHYINGAAGLAHLHRLRALVDAVVVGVGTAIADDPQLTVRRVEGPSPARVVVDPSGRLPSSARALAADGVRRLVVRGDGARTSLPAGVEIVPIATEGGRIAPSAILTALAARGFGRILIEGGADTISRFLAAGCLDRLHIVIAPIILGSGPASLTLPPIKRVDEAMHAPIRAHVIGEEVLLDCDLSAQRVAIGRAKMST
jgi:diaminohydroxyphosphoribosylaminopyrimidine deaminase / 5-amino-6-(5-phosphoribosylamino)uracil reductase